METLSFCKILLHSFQSEGLSHSVIDQTMQATFLSVTLPPLWFLYIVGMDHLTMAQQPPKIWSGCNYPSSHWSSLLLFIFSVMSQFYSSNNVLIEISGDSLRCFKNLSNFLDFIAHAHVTCLVFLVVFFIYTILFTGVVTSLRVSCIGCWQLTYQPLVRYNAHAQRPYFNRRHLWVIRHTMFGAQKIQHK